MARFRLQTQLLISTLLVLCTLTGAILFIIRQTVRSQIAVQVSESTAASAREFEMIRQQLQLELSRTAAMLAEIPTLKALMTTRDAPTIQDGSTPFWKLAGSDLFLLADPGGKVMALHVTRPGLDESEAAVHVASALKEGKDSAWWYDGGRLYWVFLRPITSGDGGNAKNLGEVAIGYEVDSSIAEQLAVVAESKIVLTADDKVIASTFSPGEESEIQKRILALQLFPGRNTQETLLEKKDTRSPQLPFMKALLRLCSAMYLFRWNVAWASSAN